MVDPQLAATPGASVTVRSLSTSTTWTASSDDNGRFSFPMLPPGVYGVEVSLSGFVPWRAEAVTLQVGQDRQLDVQLCLGNVQEGVGRRAATRARSRTAVDGVLSAARIESLPLNGRNFLELALLVPGNAPTPVFDPTKTNSVLIASAGQMGRGGNITIDGQDNNDDVVGGPLLNLPIDAVQEFQIATNRFGADLGRSASSVINVVTRSGANTPQGTAALFARDDAWQALPRHARQRAATRRPSIGSRCRARSAGRCGAIACSGSRPASSAIRTARVLVGTRDTATRTITRSFAAAPLRDGLWSLRLDTGGAANRFTVRYAGEWADDTAASAGRARHRIGDAAPGRHEPVQQRARHHGRRRRRGASSTRSASASAPFSTTRCRSRRRRS